MKKSIDGGKSVWSGQEIGLGEFSKETFVHTMNQICATVNGNRQGQCKWASISDPSKER